MATINRRAQIPELWEKVKGEAIVIPLNISRYLLPSEDTAGVITAITQADPGVLTSASHGRSNGDVVRLEDIEGMTELNGKRVTVASQATNTFALTTEETPAININTTNYTAYTRAGRWRLMQSISSATATHVPKDADGADSGTVATITVGTIANGTIPLSIPAFNADNSAGDNVYHEIHVKPVLANPTETPTFIIQLVVLDDGT